MSTGDRIFEAVATPFRALAYGAATVAAGVATVGASLVYVGGQATMVWRRTRNWSIRMYRSKIDYRYQVGDPVNNSIVGAVTAWKARNFPEAPVRIRKEGAPIDDPGVSPSLTGPGYMLRLLERPNPYYSGVLQWMATMVDFCRGNAYWIKMRGPSSATGQRGRVQQLWWVPQHMMRPRWPEGDGTVFIGWYDYIVDGQIFQVDPQDVVHFRNGIDPMNPRLGLGPLGSLLREIYTDEEAAAFTAALLTNLGVPGVVISPANTTTQSPMKQDPATIKQKFMDTFGGDGRGEPLVLTAATEVKVLSWSPEQLNLTSLRRVPEERISSSLGVPAGVVGLGAGLDRNTFSNYGEANRAAYTQGVIPEQRLIAAELEVQLLSEFVDIDTAGLDVFFDYTQASAFLETLAEIWQRNAQAATNGLQMRSDWKRAVGKAVLPNGADDVYIVPRGWQIIPAGTPQEQAAAVDLNLAPTTPQQPAKPPSKVPPNAEYAEVVPTAASTNGNGHKELIGAAA